MTLESLRQALRSHTSQLHGQLDRMVGAFDSVDTYRHFVIRSYQFRSAAEPCLASWSAWRVQNLATLQRRDLDDLAVGRIEVPLMPVPPADLAAAIGGLYVLEGSSVGARLLLRRAGQLGFGEHRAARHLAVQAGDTLRWSRFLDLLESVNVDRQAALGGARTMFELALSIYSESVREQA